MGISHYKSRQAEVAGLAAALARQPGVQGKSGRRANRGCHRQAVCGSMTHSAGPRSPCAGGRPDWNGTQGVGVPGIVGVLRPAGVDANL